MPRISVVIPTLNRAHLLDVALRSCLKQTYDDYEVIVSDDESEDATQSVAEAHASRDPRVRYFRTPSRLNMHESFEFALNQARGEFVTFLTDDSYLLPWCLKTAVHYLTTCNVRLAAWRHAGYFDHDWFEPARRNTLFIPRVTGRALELQAKESLRKWFRSIQGASAFMPRSINSLCGREIIEAARSRQGKFFLPPAPDHSSGVAMLMNVDTYVAIDDVLVIDGVTRESIGPSQSFGRGPGAAAFYSSFGKALQEVTYLGIPTTSAVIAQSFENARRSYPDAPTLSRRGVLVQMIGDLARLEAYGLDVAALYELVHEELRAENGVKMPFTVLRLKARAQWSLLRRLRSRNARWIERLRGLRVVPGSRLGFNDIEGAAGYLVQNPRG